MDVKQLIRRLNDFDTNAVVTVGDEGRGWSNIESVIEDSSCVKILMSDNVVFSDDRASKAVESAPSASTNTASFQLPLSVESCLDHLFRLWLSKPLSKDAVQAVEETYDYIERQLQTLL